MQIIKNVWQEMLRFHQALMILLFCCSWMMSSFSAGFTPDHPSIESVQWKLWIPAENDDIIYEQPLSPNGWDFCQIAQQSYLGQKA